MKKQVKQIITALAIMAVTLIAGFGVTILSFNLIDSMSVNQMRILFTIDILALLISAAGVWHFFESKKLKAKRQKEYQKRKAARISQSEKEMKEINEIINLSNFAA